jgi:hypothetical protein
MIQLLSAAPATFKDTCQEQSVNTCVTKKAAPSLLLFQIGLEFIIKHLEVALLSIRDSQVAFLAAKS